MLLECTSQGMPRFGPLSWARHNWLESKLSCSGRARWGLKTLHHDTPPCSCLGHSISLMCCQLLPFSPFSFSLLSVSFICHARSSWSLVSTPEDLTPGSSFVWNSLTQCWTVGLREPQEDPEAVQTSDLDRYLLQLTGLQLTVLLETNLAALYQYLLYPLHPPPLPFPSFP